MRLSLEHWSIGYPYATVGLRDVPGVAGLVLLAVATVLVLVGLAIRRRTVGCDRAPGQLDRRTGAGVRAGARHPRGCGALQRRSGRRPSSAPATSRPPGLLSRSPRERSSPPPARALRIAAATLAIACFAIGAAKLLEDRYQRPDYTAVANFIERTARPADVVIDESAVLSPGPLSHLDTVLDNAAPGGALAGATAARPSLQRLRHLRDSRRRAPGARRSWRGGARIFLVTTHAGARFYAAAAVVSAGREPRLPRAARAGRPGVRGPGRSARMTLWAQSRRASGMRSTARSATAAARSAASRHEVGHQPELSRRQRSRARGVRVPAGARPRGSAAPHRCPGARGPSASASRDCAGCGPTRGSARRAGVTRVISASVPRTSAASAMWCITATLSTRSKLSSGKGIAVPVRPHRLDSRCSRAQHVEHALGGVDAGHVVPGVGEPGRERAGAAAHVEPAPAGAVGEHEGDALAQVVLDHVRGERLVVRRRDRVKVGAAHACHRPGRGRVLAQARAP